MLSKRLRGMKAKMRKLENAQERESCRWSTIQYTFSRSSENMINCFTHLLSRSFRLFSSRPKAGRYREGNFEAEKRKVQDSEKSFLLLFIEMETRKLPIACVTFLLGFNLKGKEFNCKSSFSPRKQNFTKVSTFHFTTAACSLEHILRWIAQRETKPLSELSSAAIMFQVPICSLEGNSRRFERKLKT